MQWELKRIMEFFYPKHHGILDNTGNSEIRKFEHSPYSFDVADVTFGLGNLASIESATMYHPVRCRLADATSTANDDVTSSVLSHVNS